MNYLRRNLTKLAAEGQMASMWDAVEDALVAERAATIEEAAKLLDARAEATDSEPFHLMARAVRALPHDRSALDEILTKAEEKGWSKAVSETIQHFSAGPQSGCGCAYCDPRTRCGNALVQARREQRDKDADKLDAMAAKMAYSSGDPRLRDRDADAMLEDSSAYQRAAAAIRAQED